MMVTVTEADGIGDGPAVSVLVKVSIVTIGDGTGRCDVTKMLNIFNKLLLVEFFTKVSSLVVVEIGLLCLGRHHLLRCQQGEMEG